ncbi:MAG: pyridoxine 5'-phosphate synthase [Elusimicrobiota bacterium]|jgi:pyridoxine 5-phosphate synthase|nr:pyridoxine 5'-phosphate synthase [Elusimicrobiota bacterium]
MIKLGVNIDHIATIRQARKECFPSVVSAALVCQKAGADGITIHLREDRRHIQDEDVYNIRDVLQIKLNLEMSTSKDIVEIALDAKPDSVCLVPEKREELTTEGGLDVKNNQQELSEIILKLKNSAITVSVFVEPDIAQIQSSYEIGADAVELHTGKYANLFKNSTNNFDVLQEELSRIYNASTFAVKKGLILNAGHGLDYDNCLPICKIPDMSEFNIGFAIIARAVFEGLENAVKNMKELINR